MMKFLILLPLLAAASTPAFAQQVVRPYVKNDGTYVGSHIRSTPNSTAYDNYSTRGNTNPFTGQKGYVNPYPSYNNNTYNDITPYKGLNPYEGLYDD